ncbi:hypothetical protein ACIHIX_24780 [Streptomyces sp. NPDC051913]|uniref:hypothetical protein n=1 Tax=Streptomyces sp. NPDC051913 TaxID=3365676 RepID=UPI0037D595FF
MTPGTRTAKQKTSHARNTSAWLVNAVSRTKTYSTTCAAIPVTPDDAVSHITTAYVGQTAEVAPTKGELTATYRVASHSPVDKSPVYEQVSSCTHLRQAGSPAHPCIESGDRERTPRHSTSGSLAA